MIIPAFSFAQNGYVLYMLQPNHTKFVPMHNGHAFVTAKRALKRVQDGPADREPKPEPRDWAKYQPHPDE